jgi:hypothetical protein
MFIPKSKLRPITPEEPRTPMKALDVNKDSQTARMLADAVLGCPSLTWPPHHDGPRQSSSR